MTEETYKVVSTVVILLWIGTLAAGVLYLNWPRAQLHAWYGGGLILLVVLLSFLRSTIEPDDDPQA